MSVRLKFAVLIAGMIVVGGCTAPGKYNGTGRPSPTLKCENGPRLAKELGWFYADVQDFVFGVDHHQDLEDRHGLSPYQR